MICPLHVYETKCCSTGPAVITVLHGVVRVATPGAKCLNKVVICNPALVGTILLGFSNHDGRSKANPERESFDMPSARGVKIQHVSYSAPTEFIQQEYSGLLYWPAIS